MEYFGSKENVVFALGFSFYKNERWILKGFNHSSGIVLFTIYTLDVERKNLPQKPKHLYESL